MEKDWTVVFETTLKYKVELMKHHLEVAGIESVILDQTVSLYVGFPDFENTVKLQVRKEDEVQAKEILKKYVDA